MRIDLGLILAIMLEAIFFIYYANSLYEMKNNKIWSYGAIVLLYALNFVSCMFGNGVVNLTVFTLTNLLLLTIFYGVKTRWALFQSIILSAIMMAGELMVFVIEFFDFDMAIIMSPTPGQSMIITVIGKLFYLTGIMGISYISGRITNKDGRVPISLILIPILSIICLFCIMGSGTASVTLVWVTIIMVLLNITVFWVSHNIINRDAENIALKEQLFGEKIDTVEYAVLKDKYEQTRIFHHDFKEQMYALNNLIGDDNAAAKEYIKSICNVEEASRMTKYTDNKILNILINTKKEKCLREGISFYVDPIFESMTFLKDTDAVSIFSNLLNNAIESCMNSQSKNIYLSVYSSNKSYVVIKVKNNCDRPPVIVRNSLKTHKEDDIFHGIGINSIKNTIKKYNGELSWSYDRDNKMFETNVIIGAI